MRLQPYSGVLGKPWLEGCLLARDPGTTFGREYPGKKTLAVGTYDPNVQGIVLRELYGKGEPLYAIETSGAVVGLQAFAATSNMKYRS